MKLEIVELEEFMEAIKLEEKFDGHIILYCKGQYNVDNVNLIEGLRNIWAVRCGIHQNSNFNKLKYDEFIANRLFSILTLIIPDKIPYINEMLIRDLVRINNEENTPIEVVILCYTRYIADLEIFKLMGDYCEIATFVKLVELPEPQNELFDRIIRGNALKGDYELVVG